MRQIFIVIMILTTSCTLIRKQDKTLGELRNRSFHYDSIARTSIPIDSSELIKLIKGNDEILRDDVHTNVSQRKGTKFSLIETGPCGKNMWSLILKESPADDRFRKPYRGLFLVLQNTETKVIEALKLTEYFDIQFTTNWESKTTSKFKDYSTLITKEVSTACSDVGKLTCWETTITRQWTLNCDRFVLNRTDTTKIDLQ
jgi:hypothetical protein